MPFAFKVSKGLAIRKAVVAFAVLASCQGATPTSDPANPGTVTNLAVAGLTNNSATLSFTEVNDGAGQPARYEIRWAVGVIVWGAAPAVTQGSCTAPVAGSGIGKKLTCTVLALTPGTGYQFQVIAFRGTPNVNAVVGGLSNVASGTTTGAPSPGVLFASDWSYATGNSDAALRDGTKWDVALVGGTQALNPDEAVVVNTTAPPGATNALRCQQQGSGANGWSMIGKINFAPLSQDYYLRYYVRNDDVAGTSQDHIVEPGPPTAGMGDYNELTFLNKAEYATGWRPRLVLGATQPPNTTMPNWDLGEAPGVLAYGRWYRFEYWVQFTAPTRIQVHPRIYDDTGALLYSDADFIADPGYGVWPGATLASYYAGTNPTGGPRDFGITPLNVVNIQFGNNGSSAATNTGLYWYYAKVMIRSDTWAGP